MLLLGRNYGLRIAVRYLVELFVKINVGISSQHC